LTPGFSGRVVAVHVNAGQNVTPDQLLVTVHQPTLALQLQNARQTLVFLRAQAVAAPSTSLPVQIAEHAAKVRELEAVLNTSTTIRSPGHIRLLELNVTADDLIRDDDVIAIYEQSATGSLYLEAFVPVMEGKEIRPGALVQVMPNAIRQENAGYVRGTVRSVSEFPVSPENLKATLRNEDLAKLLTAHGNYTKVTIDLPSNGSGKYEWSVKSHPPVELTPGTICQIRIVTARIHPYRFILP
jgi:HlyD family secretion protein